MPHPEVLKAFNDLFDILVSEFNNLTDDPERDVSILDSSMGVMMVFFDFKKKQAFLNYKGSASVAEVHQLLREHLDNPDATRVKP